MRPISLSETEQEAVASAARSFSAGNREEAFGKYRALAEDGFVRCQEFLGWMYFNGCGTEKNLELAAKWFKAAADNGSIAATYRLGVAYVAQQKLSAALECFSKCEAAGYAPGIVRLGRMYEDGKGLDRDYEAAMAKYGVAARLGNVQGLRRLGFLEVRDSGSSFIVGVGHIAMALWSAFWINRKDPHDERLLD